MEKGDFNDTSSKLVVRGGAVAGRESLVTGDAAVMELWRRSAVDSGGRWMVVTVVVESGMEAVVKQSVLFCVVLSCGGLVARNTRWKNWEPRSNRK